jgi:hypothetical protein
MDTALLGRLLLYVVYRASELGGYTTTIRLVKFLYLIDLEHQRRLGHPLTGLEWVYHLYGPYAFAIPEAGKRLGFDLQREEFVNVKGHHGTLLQVHTPQSFPAELDRTAQVIVDGLLNVWANVETRLLLQYVYETEPMKTAQRGDRLDFYRVPDGTYYYELYVSIPEGPARQLRESIRSYAQEDADEFVPPATVIDDILVAGLRALDDQENLSPEMASTRLTIDVSSLKGSLPSEG